MYRRHLPPNSKSLEDLQDIRLGGSLFHFAQTIWHRVQASSLVEAYMTEENEDLYIQFHSIIALAFIL